MKIIKNPPKAGIVINRPNAKQTTPLPEMSDESAAAKRAAWIADGTLTPGDNSRVDEFGNAYLSLEAIARYKEKLFKTFILTPGNGVYKKRPEIYGRNAVTEDGEE